MSKKMTNEYDELEHIKADLNSLKSNVVTLTQHLAQDSYAKAGNMRSYLKDAALAARKDGERRYKDVEKKVKEHPGQAVLIAFASGMLASALLKRRG